MPVPIYEPREPIYRGGPAAAPAPSTATTFSPVSPSSAPSFSPSLDQAAVIAPSTMTAFAPPKKPGPYADALLWAEQFLTPDQYSTPDPELSYPAQIPGSGGSMD